MDLVLRLVSSEEGREKDREFSADNHELVVEINTLKD